MNLPRVVNYDLRGFIRLATGTSDRLKCLLSGQEPWSSGEETHVPKVVGSNPGTVYWMDIFSQIIVVKIEMMFVWKDRK